MKVNQRVKLLGYSTKNTDNYNPKDCLGTVISLDGKMNPIIVEWDNGYRNSYSERELETVFQNQTKNTFL